MEIPVAVVDPGHGDTDPGSGTEEFHESQWTLRIGLALRDKLTTAGWAVLMTRETEVAVPLWERAALGPMADVFLSIHNNSFGNDAAHGIETWYQQGDPSSRRFAEMIQAAATSGFPELTDRGLKEGSAATRTDWYTFDESKNDVLFEGPFISNPGDRTWMGPEYDAKWADVLYAGIIATVPYDDSAAPVPPEIMVPLQQKLEWEALARRAVASNNELRDVIGEQFMEMEQIEREVHALAVRQSGG